jgi:hypothetical protein
VPTAERRCFRSFFYVATALAVLAALGLCAGGFWMAQAHSLPLALAVAATGFVVLQWLVDRRDPKFVEAPARRDDDSLGFE